MKQRATEALLAVLDGDENRCRELLSTLPPGELHELRCAASLLRNLTLAVHRQSKGK